jgi:hypothetical protein
VLYEGNTWPVTSSLTSAGYCSPTRRPLHLIGKWLGKTESSLDRRSL